MKKTTLFLAGMLFVGISASFAQQDTSSTQRQRRPAQSTQPTQSTPPSQSSQPSQTSPSDNARQRDADQNYTKDMVKVQQSEIPENLRTTLGGSQYKGWENGTVYRSKNGDGYLVEIKDGNRTQVHRFDANGRPQNQ